MCANTDREYERYQEADIRTIMEPKNIFTRLDRFLVPEQRSPKAFDAVYVARLVEMKRQHLAAQIDRLMCIYDNTSLENLHTFKEMLPRALFANHASENSSYRHRAAANDGAAANMGRRPKRRGPQGACSDAELLGHIEAVIAASPSPARATARSGRGSGSWAC